MALATDNEEINTAHQTVDGWLRSPAIQLPAHYLQVRLRSSRCARNFAAQRRKVMTNSAKSKAAVKTSPTW
jgi:hypothetical protein